MECKQAKVAGRNPLEIQLTVKRAQTLIIVSLSVFLVLSILLSVVGIGYALIYGNGPHIGFLFALGVDFLITRFLVRTILWNLYGCEHLKFWKDKFTYQADYRYFMGPIRSLLGDYEPYYFFPDEDGEFVSIGVRNSEDRIETVINLPLNEVEKIWENELGDLTLGNQS